MLRLSEYMNALAQAERTGQYPQRTARQPRGPVVIWNLIRRCNLTCQHCYALSADTDYAGELSTAQAKQVMQDLKDAGVPALILSGGEPLLRPDLFELAAHAKAMKFYVGLSTNGTLIDPACADRIAGAGFDYVGISLDGIGAVHDRFRRLQGAYDRSLQAMRWLRQRDVKVGMRYTMTASNGSDFAPLLELMRQERISKFYFSHLNYAGRGNLHRAKDAHFEATRQALDLLLDTAWLAATQGQEEEFVTGNNDADGVYLLQWAQRHFPQWAEHLRQDLIGWGGNASGISVANIDNLGLVHPDTMWWHHTLGDVRQRRFGDIWADTTDPLMAGLKQRPRPVQGRCAQCQHLAICNGNTRVRADQVTGSPWSEDPGCYLRDDEIGASTQAERVVVTPYRYVPH